MTNKDFVLSFISLPLVHVASGLGSALNDSLLNAKNNQLPSSLMVNSLYKEISLGSTHLEKCEASLGILGKISRCENGHPDFLS